MAEINFRAFFILLSRLVLTAVFLLSSLPKIQDPVNFTVAIEAYQIVGSGLSIWIALILPWLELVIGIGILIPRLRRASSLILVILLVLFICLHASAWMRGLDISCGCFGQAPTVETPSYYWKILQNLALLLAAYFIFMRDLRQSRIRVATKA